MPGYPKIDKSSNKQGDKTISITKYQRAIDNGQKNYTLAVYDYSLAPFDDEKKALESALNSGLQNTPGATVTDSKTGTYNDLNAIEATYSLTQKSKTYESHIRYVIKGTRMYSIILIGDNQQKFDEFANSLRLN